MSFTALGAQPTARRTYANPIDIDYRYNFEQHNQGISYRSGADPVIVVQKGAYYLFETIGGGYWRSTDLTNWTHITPTRWPWEEIVAPAALSVRDTIYLLQAAMGPRPIAMLTQPATGRVEFFNRMMPPLPYAVVEGSDRGVRRVHPDSLPPGPWDPALFADDGDRWYLYWGSSNAYPLYGIALDKQRGLSYVGRPKALIALDPVHHGWERFGRDHGDSITPFIEGAWMTKHGGRYYLQYAGPGTEYNVYANGTYVGGDPLGPFTYAPYNPIAYKPGGFMAGAGHGNTFLDVFGNWWNTGTPWVAVNWNFERRIAMHPAGFDADGDMYADTRFGDFPRWVPTKKWVRSDELFTGWMLLSYGKEATASSARDSFPATTTTDENPRTYWVAARNAPGEWLTVDLGHEADVRAVQVNYADYQSGLFANDSSVYTRFRLSHSRDGKRWASLADLSRETRDRPNAYIELPRAVRTRFVRYEHLHVGARNLAISDVRVFGNAPGTPSATPRRVSARRETDARDATVSWDAVPGAVGYNVRWGIAPTKLRQTYQVWADRPTTLRIRALTLGQRYWFAVEAFNETGVSAPSDPVEVP